MILEDGQPSGGLKLLIIQSKKICFRLFNLVKHLFSQLLCGLNSLPFFVIDFFQLILLFSFQLNLQVCSLLIQFISLLLEFF